MVGSYVEQQMLEREDMYMMVTKLPYNCNTGNTEKELRLAALKSND